MVQNLAKFNTKLYIYRYHSYWSNPSIFTSLVSPTNSSFFIDNKPPFLFTFYLWLICYPNFVFTNYKSSLFWFHAFSSNYFVFYLVRFSSDNSTHTLTVRIFFIQSDPNSPILFYTGSFELNKSLIL